MILCYTKHILSSFLSVYILCLLEMVFWRWCFGGGVLEVVFFMYMC